MESDKLQEEPQRRPRRFFSGLYATSERFRLVKASQFSSDHLSTWTHSVGSPLKCTNCFLRLRLTERIIVYSLTTKYRVEMAAECRFALFFPVSVSASPVTSVSVRIAGRAVAALLQPVFDTLYAIVPNASEVMSPNAINVGDEVMVELMWRTRTTSAVNATSTSSGSSIISTNTATTTGVPNNNKYPLFSTSVNHLSVEVRYALQCAPRRPDSVVCRAQFPSRVALVRSPSCRMGCDMDWRAYGGLCKVRISDTVTALRDDFTELVLVFYFMNEPEEGGRQNSFNVVVIVVAAAIVLWYMLTKDLQL